MTASPNRPLVSLFVTIFAIFLLTHQTAAQPPGFGRGGFGGFGGDDFRRRMMERMDRNGNGQLEEDEVSDRARGFVEGMARGRGVEVKYPLAIDRIVGSSRGSDRGRGRGDDRGRRDDGRRSDRGRDDDDDSYPLVLGFGDESVLGFGIHPNLFNGRVIDVEKNYSERIVEMVDRTLDRYDKDKTGVLEHDEWGGARWSEDPRESDVDNDGRLTRAELAERYAKRSSNSSRDRDNRDRGDRGDRDRSDRGRDSSRSFGRGGSGGDRGGDSGRGRFGRGGDSDRGGFGRGGFGGPGGRFGGRDRGGGEGDSGRGRGGFDPTRMLSSLDSDGDGVIDVNQLDERRRGFATMMLGRLGVDASRPVRIDELRKKIEERRNGGGDSNSSRGRDGEPKKKEVKASYTTEGASKFKGRSSYRREEEAAPRGMPRWWDDRDRNTDGQVTLGEFLSSRATTREIRDFEEYDLNGDGIITSGEAEVVEDN